MARSKKSRKVGRIGTPSVSKEERKRSRPLPVEGKSKKTKGNPSGSRHSAVAISTSPKLAQQQSDPRIGSKKPISLVADTTSVKGNKPVYFTPTQELAALENDPRLSKLLDQLDEGETLSKADQQFVDEKLSRHKILCDLLGIKDDAEEEDSLPDDPFERLNAIDINKFK